MQALLTTLKYLFIVFILILAAAFYFFDDLKRYSIQTLITQLTNQEKYLTGEYTIFSNNDDVVVRDLNIKKDNLEIHIPEIILKIPFLYLLNNCLEIKILNSEIKFDSNMGSPISLVGSLDIKYWNTGHNQLDTINADLLFGEKKILNLRGNYNSNKNRNIIALTNYSEQDKKMGEIAFIVENRSLLTIDRLSIPFGGGIINAADIKLDLLDHLPSKIIIEVNDVAIDSIIKLEDFKAEGKISGKMEIDPENLKITNLKLETNNNGLLSYKSNKLLDLLGNKNLSFLHKALTSFEYRKISIESISEDNKNDNIKISIYEVDKKLYSERPLNININLDLDLKAIAKSYIMINK